MYIPKHFEEKDIEKLVAFMREYSFAVLVSGGGDRPIATHLPFVIEEDGNEIILKSHMAKANPQWKEFNDSGDVLVIFQEPHSYISPKLYDHKRNVSTWNYIAVHAYGKPEIITIENEAVKILELMFRQFDQSYKKQWDELDPDYKNKMLKGIVAFKIKLKKLEGKFKLSQNKTGSERERIKQFLENDPDTIKSDLSKFM